MFRKFKEKIFKQKIVVDCLIVGMIGLLGVTIYQWKDGAKAKSYTASINSEVVSKINEYNYKDEIRELKQKNEDVLGLIEIPNTDFKRVLVQSKDNQDYLKKNLDKHKDKNGTPFLDYRTNLDSKKLVIYGHNSRFTEMPFNYLMNYYDEAFIDRTKYIDIKTENGIQRYEVFSVFTETSQTSDWSYTDVEFETDEDFIKNIESLKNKSIFKRDFDIKDKQILVLQTCSTKKEYLKYERRFLVIVAGRVS